VSPPRRVFQDQRVTDHHAIIPTTTTLTDARLAALSVDQRKLHDLVVRRFLGVFFPDAEFAQTTVTVRVEAEGSALGGALVADSDGRLPGLPTPPDRYVAQGKQRLIAGWQEVAGFDGESDGKRRSSAEESDGSDDDEALRNQPLPRLQKGDVLHGSFSVLAKQTRPPPRFSDASLLSAMESAGKQLSDEALRRAMKDSGLGTPATRAAVIETLISRRYVERRGKQLWPTLLGMDLIDKLPEASLASAELTGQWEARLNRMARGEDSAQDFMASIVAYVEQLIGKVRAAPTPAAIAVNTGQAATPAVRDSSTGRRRTNLRSARPSRASSSTTKERGVRPASVSRIAKPKGERKQQERPSPGTRVEPSLVCPRCQSASLIWGKSAWGCSDYRVCRLVIPFVVEGVALTEKNLASLVTARKVQLQRQGKRVTIRLAPSEEPAAQVDKGSGITARP
jgi:DNA topoisomerase-3